MKTIYSAALLLLLNIATYGQVSLTVGVGDPTGACTTAWVAYRNETTGERWDCVAGAWSNTGLKLIPSPASIANGGTGQTTAGAAFNALAPSKSGNTLKVLRVNAGETDYELVTLAGGGDALVANPLSQFAATTSAQLAGVLSDESGTSGGFVRSGGGALTALTGLGVRSTGAAFDLTIATSEVLTAGRTLSIVLNDAARTLTISGAATISGTNTGDQTSVSGNAGTATTLQTARTIGGTSFNGSADITVATATGGFTVSGGNLALGANNLTMTGSLGATGARLTKGWLTDLEVTNTIVGAVNGNAATATALQNARTIGGNTFDGTANITIGSATAGFTVSGGTTTLATGTTSIAPLTFLSGTNLTTTIAGAQEFDGKVFYSTPVVGDRGVTPSMLFRALDANATGNDSATAQGWFPTNGAVSVQASTAYFFEGQISIVRTAGATSHTTGVSMDGGTATFTAIGYHVEVKEGDAATISDSDLIAIQVATDTNIKAASTSATENVVLQVWGTVWIANAGTFKPMFKYSAAPGGVPTIEKGTYFKLYPVGTNTVTTVGTWQ